MHLNHDLGVVGLLIGIVNASEALDLTRACSLVQALGVALLAHLDGDLHEHLQEVALRHTLTHLHAVRLVRRDEAHKSDGAVLSKKLGHLANAADVLLAVLGRKAKVLVQAMTDVIAVQVDSELAQLAQGVLQGAGDGALTAAAQASEPEDATLLVQQVLLVCAADHALVPLDVGRLAHVVGGGLHPAAQGADLGGEVMDSLLRGLRHAGGGRAQRRRAATDQAGGELPGGGGRAQHRRGRGSRAEIRTVSGKADDGRMCCGIGVR
mmetsp:Transcript_18564/g.48506  ORF Transcript_18564/g.48506 Transcript_18564/m.48506 type:complete len:266 (+) Transcript_18564:1382-2179(+)